MEGLTSFKKTTLSLIKKYNGLECETCDFYLDKLKNKESIFDVILNKPMWLSNEYDKLLSFAKAYNIDARYVGYKRVRFYNPIFFKR